MFPIVKLGQQYELTERMSSHRGSGDGRSSRRDDNGNHRYHPEQQLWAGAGPCGPVASSLDMAGMKIPSAGHPVALAL